MTNTLIDHIQSVGIANVWKAILNLVDYMVVAFLIFISFANILKIQIDTYAIKKTIPSLVLGVVLANLSWYICIMIIDFAHVLVVWEQKTMLADMLKGTAGADYYNNYMGPGTLGDKHGFLSLIFYAIFGPVLDAKNGQGFINLLMLILGVAAAFVNPVVGVAVAATQLPGIFQTLLGALLFIVQFLLILFTYFMFIVRVAVVDFLVIASPLAFLSIGFPMTQKLFQQWWSQFARWVFMAPLAFFVWAVGIIVALNIEKAGGGWGASAVAGIMKYVILGACLYFAVKLPFMLGGGIMNAWGGLGAKIGKWAGRATNDKIGDWTQGGLRLWGMQLTKPLGRRLDFIGSYQGWVQGATESHQRKVAESAGTMRDFREASLGFIPRAWSQKKQIADILTGKKEGGLEQIKNIGMGQRWQAGGQAAMMESIQKDLPNYEGWDDKMLEDGFNEAVKSHDSRKAATALSMGARRGKSWANDKQETFLKEFGENNANIGLLKSIERDSRRKDVIQNYSSERVTPFVSGWEIGKNGKPQRRDKTELYNSTMDQLENENILTRGQIVPHRLTQYLQKEQGEWSTSHFAAFSYLDQLDKKHGLDSASKSTLEGLRGKYKSFAPQEVQDATHSLFNTLDSTDIDLKKRTIKESIDVLVNPKLKLENPTVEKASAAHFLCYVRNNRPDLIRQFGIDKTQMNEAIGKVTINPVMAITPKLTITPHPGIVAVAKHWGINDTEIIKNLTNVESLPKEINLSDERQLNMAIQVHANHPKITGNLQELMNKSHDEIKGIFKDSEGGSDINEVLSTNVNVREKVKENREKIKTMTNSQVEEHIVKLEEIQASKQKIDSTKDAVKQYKDAKDNIKNFLEGNSNDAQQTQRPPAPDAEEDETNDYDLEI